MNGFLHSGILLLLRLASLSFAFEKEPYNGAIDEGGDDVGKDHGGPQMYESPGRRAGGPKPQGAVCQYNRECGRQLNCCHAAGVGSGRMQCYPCRGHQQPCGRLSDCIAPLTCSQKLNDRREPIGRPRCIQYRGPPPYGEQVFWGPGK